MSRQDIGYLKGKYKDTMCVFTKEQSAGSSTDLLRLESLPDVELKSKQKLERKSIFHH